MGITAYDQWLIVAFAMFPAKVLMGKGWGQGIEEGGGKG